MPIALGAGAVLYLRLAALQRRVLPGQGADDRAPLAMLVADAPAAQPSTPAPAAERLGSAHQRLGLGAARRLAWGCCRAFVAGALYSSFLVLRDAPVGPPGHGAELQRLPADPARQAGPLRGPGPLRRLRAARRRHPRAAGRVPRPEVSQNLEKPFDTGDAYSPIDFDSFSRATLNRFPYVITGRAAWNSQAPPNFRRIAATPSYILWERTGPTRATATSCSRGPRPAARADCASPEIRILLANAGPRLALPDAVIGPKSALAPRQRHSAPAKRPRQTPEPAGRALAPLAAVLLALRPDPQAPGFSSR